MDVRRGSVYSVFDVLPSHANNINSSWHTLLRDFPCFLLFSDHCPDGYLLMEYASGTKLNCRSDTSKLMARY